MRHVKTQRKPTAGNVENKGLLKKSGRIPAAQDFNQRNYDKVPEEMEQQLADEVRAFISGNGGESDA